MKGWAECGGSNSVPLHLLLLINCPASASRHEKSYLLVRLSFTFPAPENHNEAGVDARRFCFRNGVQSSRQSSPQWRQIKHLSSLFFKARHRVRSVGQSSAPEEEATHRIIKFSSTMAYFSATSSVPQWIGFALPHKRYFEGVLLLAQNR
jgi:hypothetical protein